MYPTAQFHFLEYIIGNQTVILDFHRPFICSVLQILYVYLSWAGHLCLCVFCVRVIYRSTYLCWFTEENVSETLLLTFSWNDWHAANKNLPYGGRLGAVWAGCRHQIHCRPHPRCPADSWGSVQPRIWQTEREIWSMHGGIYSDSHRTWQQNVEYDWWASFSLASDKTEREIWSMPGGIYSDSHRTWNMLLGFAQPRT